MITGKELLEAIAECQGTRNPNASTCIKLAAFYTILDHVQDDPKKQEEMLIYPRQYSYDPPEQVYTSETEFGKLLGQKSTVDVLEVVDELMETLRVMQPKLYNAFIRKIATR